MSYRVSAVPMDPEFERNLVKDIKVQKYRRNKNKSKTYIPPANANKIQKRRCIKTHKICYSKKEAETAVNSPIRHKKIPVRYYYCDFCNYYHTTSKPTFTKKGK